jgi:asparagine synthase (glutamine-hydrolysing)
MNGLEVLHPFRDRDLLEFLMAIPGEVVNLDGVPKGLLREAMRGVLPEPIRNRRSKADFTALSNRGIAREYPLIKELIASDSCVVRAGLVDPGVVLQELAALKAQLDGSHTAVAGWRLISLASLEVWMREFFGPQLGVVGSGVMLT